jgi:Membrane protein involved in the export of O-antigen and teichoic acid
MQENNPEIAEESLKEKTAKGLFWGGVGNGALQIAGLLFGIYLARTLSIEDYGLVASLLIFTGIASSIINGGFTYALVNKQDTTQKDYNAVFWFSFLTSILLYIILYFSAPLIAIFFEHPELTLLSRVLFLSFIFASIGTVPHAIIFKQIRVKEQAIIEIISILGSGTTGVFLAWKGFGYWALVAQSTIYILLNTLSKLIIASWRPNLSLDFNPLRAFFSFSIKILLTNIFLQINANVFSAILAKVYNITQAGYYSQSNKWMSMGNNLLTGMIHSIAQPVFVAVKEEKERQVKIFRKMIRFSAFLSFPAMLGLAFISNELIILAIGEKWSACIPILRLLCFIGAIYPIWHLYTQLLISHSKSDIYLKGNIIQGGLQIAVLLALAQHGLLVMVIAYVTTYYISLLYWHYHVNKIIGIRISELIKDILPYIVITLAVFTIVWLLTLNINNLIMLLISKILLSASLYSLILWFSKSIIFRECVELLFKKR